MPIDTTLLSVSLAHHLTPGMLATWSPTLARTPRVMVPIQLDALVVREEGGVWAQVAMKVPEKDSNQTAHTLLAEPFSEREPRKKGVYLHWALPDALTRGAGTANSGDVSFPAVPDRWLVVRLSTAKGGARRTVTGWVIEAGDEQPVVQPLDTWTEEADPTSTVPPGQEPLTVLGHGDSAWSAYFDNVEGRLGFYDDLTLVGGTGATGDVQGPLAYLVCGWHSQHVDDPIGEGLRSPTDFENRLEQLGWEVNPADIEAAFVYAQQRIKAATTLGMTTREARFSVATEAAAGKRLVADGVFGEVSTQRLVNGTTALGKWFGQLVSWPEFTLYHGAIVGLGWPEDGLGVAPNGLLGGSVGGPPAPDRVTVTVGNTLTEALAARLAHNQGQPDEARILEAVLLGATEELDLPDGPARIDSRLHGSGFAGLPGGVVSEPLAQSTAAPATSVVADPARTDPGVFPPPPPSGGSSKVTKVHLDGQLLGHVNTSLTAQISPTTGTGAMGTVLKVIKQQLGEVTVRVPHVANAEPAVETVTAQRALPRFFVPADPVFLIEGGGRAFKHGFDGMHAESNKLVCRLSGHTVTDLEPLRLARLPGGAVKGEDVLDRGVDHGGVPVECDDLLRELALLDPGSASVAAQSRFGDNARFTADVLSQVTQVYAVEQMAWWVGRDDRRDIAPLLAASGIAGTLPAAIAVSLPTVPWVPLHLDWEVELLPANDLTGWQLEEIDFDAKPETMPAVDQPATRTLTGRALLGGGAAQLAAATVRQVLEQAQQTAGSVSLTPGTTHAYHSKAAKEMVNHIGALASSFATKARERRRAEQPNALAAGRAGLSAEDEADLDHIADELEKMDVLVGAMDRFNSMLRAGFVADGVARPADGDPVPADFWPLRSGFMRVTRLRLVDCFGQVLDLAGSAAGVPARPDAILTSEPLTVEDRTDLIELAPRFTAPSRLWFRFISAADDAVEATDANSPVCGFVLPNHLDGDLQFHAADGTGLGAVRFDGGRTAVGVADEPGSLGAIGAGVVWEDSPGQPTNLGASPASTIRDPHLAAIAQGLLDWGALDATPDAPAVDTALSSLLRIVDASLWSVDPFAHIGEEHLALLVGHPIAVLRALVRVEVDEPVTPDVVRGLRVPVRVGALAHWQDGLLAYFVGDDFRTLHVPDPACADFARPVGPHEGFNGTASSTSDYYTNFATDLGAVAAPGDTPVDHPYVDTSGVLWVQPQQDVLLTLLMEPHSVVNATTGFLPRKDIGMRRSWVAPGLSRLAPVFRFGPVLVDPKLIRMPVASDIRGSWSWSHRSTPTTWADEPITNSTGDARIPPDPSQGQEGWLKLTPEEPLP